MMDKNHDNESGAIEILKQDLFKLDNEYRYVCVSIIKYVDKLTYPYSASVSIEKTLCACLKVYLNVLYASVIHAALLCDF